MKQRLQRIWQRWRRGRSEPRWLWAIASLVLVLAIALPVWSQQPVKVRT
ncbi:MAG: hypothetical protein HC838_01390 [Spirulinaceae cyanobacterium RM2_2_10]|nr:hypothetical protein [Spirulinaceae cyanobacterium RM2_2_10]